MPCHLIPRLKQNGTGFQQNAGLGRGLFHHAGTGQEESCWRLSPEFNNWVFDALYTRTRVRIWQRSSAIPVQIFPRFSGYSDMSIGVAAILGFYLPDNFYFTAHSHFTEFWRRWHISLSLLVPRLCVYSAGRKPEGKGAHVFQQLPHHAGGRFCGMALPGCSSSGVLFMVSSDLWCISSSAVSWV